MIYPTNKRWWHWLARQIAFALMDWAAEVKRGGSYTMKGGHDGHRASVWSPE